MTKKEAENLATKKLAEYIRDFMAGDYNEYSASNNEAENAWIVYGHEWSIEDEGVELDRFTYTK